MARGGMKALLCGVGAGAILWSGAAAAQAEGESGAQAGDDSRVIVVTAQRREQNLQEVPVAATVLSGSDLDAQGVEGIVSLQYAAPALVVSDYSSANVLNIRGVGRSAVDIELPSGVVIYRDGVPTFPGYFQNEPYYDIESVEVLRGPQGTFVGKSAAGGAIFINTTSPDLSGFSGRVEGEIGNREQFGGTAILNVPLSDEFGIRVAAHHFERNEVLVDSLSGNITGHPGEPNLDSIRFGALWEPRGGFRAELRVDLSDLDFGGGLTSSFGFPLYDLVVNADYAYQDRSARVVGQLGYTFPSGLELRSMTGYQFTNTINNNDQNGQLPSFAQFESAGDFELISQEFNLISPDDAAHDFSYVLGVFAQRTNQTIFGLDRRGFLLIGDVGDLGGFVQGSDFPYISTGDDYETQEDELAVFADFTYDISEQWRAEFGIRYSNYQLDQYTDIVIGNGLAPPTIPFFNGTQNLDEDDIDGKLSLSFMPTPDHNIYAIVGRGHITGGFNIFGGTMFDKSIVWNYETGWKATWANGQVQTQIGAFYQTLSNYQAQFAQEQFPDLNILQNATGSSEIYGLEAALQARVDRLSIDVSVAILESNLGEYPRVVNPFPPGGFISITGGQAPFSPEFAFNALVSYEFPLGGDYTLTPRAAVSHQGEHSGSLIENVATRLPGRTLVNAGLRLDSGRSWYAELWATNLFDERYQAGVQNFGTITFAGAPRQYGLRVGFRFGGTD